MSDNEQKNETRETIDDIVFELREHDHEMIPPYLCFDEEGGVMIGALADRIETAWARESKAIATENAVLPAVCITKQQGNAAAMHEALVAIRNALLLDSGTGPTTPFHVEVDRLTQSALSAAPRQCDVGTPYEQANRMRQFCEKQKRNGIINCGYCPIKHEYQRDCTLSWAQMPYEAEEGGTDGI